DREPLMQLVEAQSGIERRLELVGAVSCRLEAVNGVLADDLGLAGGAARRYRMARNISAEPAKPAGTHVVQGGWWAADDPAPQISVTQSAARALRLNIGSTLRWNASGKLIETRVAAIHRTDQQRLRGMMEFHMNPQAVAGLPVVYYASARVKSDAIGPLQRKVFSDFPSVTVINVAEILDRVQQVVDQISVIIRFLSGFAIFAGAIILASSVAGTRFRRIQEMAIFKTLGATRRRMAAILSLEFLILGCAAGLLGSLLANAFTALLLARFFEDVSFRFDGWSVVVSAIGTGLLATLSGWLASFRILSQRPLAVLRGE
ncbi:MAG TPA: FtsX-like permease family protein, partial [Bryobacteraceae bacterium]|nr:FtsX-like permease family protein [Bryobacteraceae bacterium]